jgi:hypothetical protein
MLPCCGVPLIAGAAVFTGAGGGAAGMPGLEADSVPLTYAEIGHRFERRPVRDESCAEDRNVVKWSFE